MGRSGGLLISAWKPSLGPQAKAAHLVSDPVAESRNGESRLCQPSQKTTTGVEAAHGCAVYESCFKHMPVIPAVRKLRQENCCMHAIG